MRISDNLPALNQRRWITVATLFFVSILALGSRASQAEDPPGGELKKAGRLGDALRPRGGVPADPGLPRGPAVGGMPIYSLISTVPGVSKLTPPEWVKPGVRVTYWFGTAIINDQAFKSTLEKDPNGDLIDPKSGDRYKRSAVPGGGGAVGFTQIEFTAVSSELVVMQVYNFLHDGSMERPQLLSTAQVTCHPSGCEYWIHPDALVKLAEQADFVFVGRQDVNGEARNVVVVKNGNGHTIYDAQSGLQLSFSMKTSSTGTGTYYDPASKTATTGQKSTATIVVGQFRGTRNTSHGKRATMPLPAWVDKVKLIEAEYRTTFEMDAGGGLQEMAAGILRIEPVKRDGNWLVLRVTTKQVRPAPMSGPTPETTRLHVSTPTEEGGTILPPEFLNGLTQGQVLDKDPITGYMVQVTYVGKAQNGRPVVVITRSGPTEKSTFVYSAQSGLMTSLEMLKRVSGSTTHTVINVTATR